MRPSRIARGALLSPGPRRDQVAAPSHNPVRRQRAEPERARRRLGAPLKALPPFSTGRTTREWPLEPPRRPQPQDVHPRRRCSDPVLIRGFREGCCGSPRRDVVRLLLQSARATTEPAPALEAGAPAQHARNPAARRRPAAAQVDGQSRPTDQPWPLRPELIRWRREEIGNVVTFGVTPKSDCDRARVRRGLGHR